MKKSIFILLLTFCTISAFTQLSISPNHTEVAACPGESITYTVNGVPSGCSIVIQLEDGNSSSFEVDNTARTFTATWDDEPQEVIVRVKAATGFTCISQTDFKIPVLSINGQTPTIAGCPGSLIIGRIISLELEAKLEYMFKGEDDEAEVAGYEWEISPSGTGWSLTTLDQGGVFSKKAQITTDIQNDATIKVKAISHCGEESIVAECFIARFVQAPCPIQLAPEFVICEDTEPFALSATTVGGVTGYTYHWTYPPQLVRKCYRWRGACNSRWIKRRNNRISRKSLWQNISFLFSKNRPCPY